MSRAAAPSFRKIQQVVSEAVTAAKSAATTSHLEGVDNIKPGDILNGFTLLRTKRVPELHLTALHLQHNTTGAQHLHIAKDDSNNVFSIGFKTNPPDQTGLPHILEHTTLCGSAKYPIRDPFFKMLPRSLSNFMNAMTASDHTFYPFATTNAKDFKNLMSVYLDATLNPLLRETDFLQEGWRVGPQNPQAIASGTAQPEDEKLVFKGVVYNEMKGQMSDSSYLFYVRFQRRIFPAINNSGGDPAKMTELTYQQLKQYQSQHYHPSNAKIFTYGDMPLAEHLEDINEQLLRFNKIGTDHDDKRPIDLRVGDQSVVEYGPLDPLADPERQIKTSVSWIMGDTSDVVESFSLDILSSLLTDGYGSPLYRRLVESGLGTDWSPNTGYDSSDRIGIFSVGLTGVMSGDVPRVKSELLDELRVIRNRGFDRGKIDGYLHRAEIGLKHKTANFGMSVMQSWTKWFNGTDPFDALAWNTTVGEFKRRLDEGNYLESLMDKYLLNANTLTFSMLPDPEFADKLAKNEESRLADKLSNARQNAGSEADAIKAFHEQELRLLEEQKKTTTENLDCLPTIHVKDIPRSKPSTPLRHSRIQATPVQWHETATNGLTYFKAVNTFKDLPAPLRPYIPLFIDCINRLGTRSKTIEQLEDLIKVKTGGISCSYHATSAPTDFTQTEEGIVLSGLALDRNVSSMFDLMREQLVETNFDAPNAPQLVRQLLQSLADGAVSDIASSGHTYASRYAEAGMSHAGWLREQVRGISQVKLVTHLARRPESDDLSDVIEKLKQIQQIVMAGDRMRVAMTCETESVEANRSQLERFLASRPLLSANPAQEASLRTPNPKTFFALPYQVYYSSMVMPTVKYTHEDGAALQVLAQLLTHKHLHHEIREKGGAYGGGAFLRAIDGVFGYYSYRDPNPVNSLGIMRNAGRWAIENKLTARDLEEAKISVFKAVDAPRSVNEKGLSLFLSGVTDEMRERRRSQLLDVTIDQVRQAAEHHVVDAIAEGKQSVALLGEEQPWVDSTWQVEKINIESAPS